MWKNPRPLFLFILLQVLDLATTVAAIALGGKELNPLVGHIMSIGPLGGLVVAKLIVVGLAVAGALLGKHRGIRIANAVFAIVIVWNCSIVARLAIA